jgi:hypothetical protein
VLLVGEEFTPWRNASMRQAAFPGTAATLEFVTVAVPNVSEFPPNTDAASKQRGRRS